MRTPEPPAPVALATERLFAALSRARGARLFHPQGVAYRATLHVEGGVAGVPLLGPGATRDAVVRFSRGLGLPRGIPEFLGLALRIEEEQDLLLASSSTSPLLRMVPLPARSFFGTTLSSLLPLQAAGRVVFVGAQIRGSASGTADQLSEIEESRPLSVVLALAELGGPWRAFATLAVDLRLPDAEMRRLRFDPWNCAGGLVPHGRINALRAPAYRGSRRGRPSA